MSIKAADLTARFRQALEEKWGYIWGKRGQLWTQAQQDAAAREMTVRYGQQWVGRKVADCSGLFVWAFRALGGDIYHGSDTIFRKYTVQTGKVAEVSALSPGAAVFQLRDGRRTHIGLYVGDGRVIEAQGTRTGVVESDIRRWDEWGLLSGVDYAASPAEPFPAVPLTLRKGDSGEAVQALQEALLAAGYDLGSQGADGIFGSKTRQAVRAFQQDHGLTPDGLAGPMTRAALFRQEEGAPEEDSTPTEESTPENESVPDEETSPETPDPWLALSAEDKLLDLHRRVRALEGGETP